MEFIFYYIIYCDASAVAIVRIAFVVVFPLVWHDDPQCVRQHVGKAFVCCHDLSPCPPQGGR